MFTPHRDLHNDMALPLEVEHSWSSEFANYTALPEGLSGRSVAVPERQRG